MIAYGRFGEPAITDEELINFYSENSVATVATLIVLILIFAAICWLDTYINKPKYKKK